MIYLLAPRPPRANLPVIFNIGGTVGASGANDSEDVMYVKWLLKTYAIASPAMPAAPRDKMLNLTVDGNCCTRTRESIVDYQRMRGEPHSTFNPEGKVSPASTTVSNWESSTQTLISLTYVARNLYKDKWPMLVQMANCSPQLAAAARRSIVGP
ncbi:MAG: hypothetical protein ACREUE_00020 [Panacagrimonas sp.]